MSTVILEVKIQSILKTVDNISFNVHRGSLLLFRSKWSKEINPLK